MNDVKMAVLKLTERDVGKTVVDQDGEAIGEITKFEGDQAYVEPADSVMARTRRKLGWGDTGSQLYALSNSMVYSIRDHEIRIRR